MRTTLRLAVYLMLGLSGCDKQDKAGDSGSTTGDAGQQEGRPSTAEREPTTSVTSSTNESKATLAESGRGSSESLESSAITSAATGAQNTSDGEPSSNASRTDSTVPGSFVDAGIPVSNDAGAKVETSHSEPSGETAHEGAHSMADASDVMPEAPQLFAGHCASCHQDEGRGDPGEAPEIQHPAPDYATWVVRNGRRHDSYLTEMPPFDEFLLPKAALSQILSYLEGMPKPTSGKALYLDYCSNCHGQDAKGGTTGESLRGQAAEIPTKVREGNDTQNFGSRTTFMPAWSESELSDEDVTAIGQYVESLSQ
jgi:mono/diheme cytochrome c family protein